MQNVLSFKGETTVLHHLIIRDQVEAGSDIYLTKRENHGKCYTSGISTL